MTDQRDDEPYWLVTLRDMTSVPGPWFIETVRIVTREALSEIERLRAEVTELEAVVDIYHEAAEAIRDGEQFRGYHCEEYIIEEALRLANAAREAGRDGA